jgi:NADH:ubiquinone oxidoreductase subunit E
MHSRIAYTHLQFFTQPDLEKRARFVELPVDVSQKVASRYTTPTRQPRGIRLLGSL